MKRTLLAILLVCLSPLSRAEGQKRAVILISLDGLAAYYFDDAKAEMPTLRRLAAEGAIAKSMTPVVPTVTWPNHTSIVTGVRPAKHGVVGNNYFDRASGRVITLLSDPEFDKEQIVHAPTIYDVAKRAGMTTAGVIWPASRNAPTLDWTVPDVATDELFLKYGTPALLAECKAANIDVDHNGAWHKSNRYNEGDQTDTEIFNLILAKHHPDLALLHLVDIDHVEHAKGPQTPEAYAAIKGADGRVASVLKTIETAYPAGSVSVIVVSDHGFHPIRQNIFPNVVLRKAGLVDVKGTRVVGGSVHAVTQGGSCLLYITDDANRAAIVDKIKTSFTGVEGVTKVVTEDGFAAYGLSTPKQDPHAPDVVLFAAGGYTFGNTTAGELAVTAKSAELRGTHGHDPLDPALGATFIAWGSGVKKGAKLDTIANTDVAPTVAALLHIEMKDVEGRVLTEAVAP